MYLHRERSGQVRTNRIWAETRMALLDSLYHRLRTLRVGGLGEYVIMKFFPSIKKHGFDGALMLWLFIGEGVIATALLMILGIREWTQ